MEMGSKINTTESTLPEPTSEQIPDSIPMSCPKSSTTFTPELETELNMDSNATPTEKVTAKEFKPRIIAFCCNWCSYAGADLAGVSRLQYPPNVRIIRVLCSGRIEPEFVLRALELGADGVLVAGCHPGDCHYISGNLKAEKRFKMLTKLLDILGINTGRARLEWISASEGPKFASTITEFVAQIKKIGPNLIKK